MRCADCGQDHPIEDIELTFRRPDVIAAMTDEERATRVKEDKDLCAIKGGAYFVRAVVPLPVHGRPENYCIGMWAEVSWPVFKRVLDLWSDPEQANEAPMAVTLANDVPGMRTLGAAATLQLTGPTSRPSLDVSDVDNPLAREQASGITPHRVHAYTLLCLPQKDFGLVQ